MIGHHDGLADAGLGYRWPSQDVEVFTDSLRVREQATHVDRVAVLGSQRLHSSHEVARRPAGR